MIGIHITTITHISLLLPLNLLLKILISAVIGNTKQIITINFNKISSVSNFIFKKDSLFPDYFLHY